MSYFTKEYGGMSRLESDVSKLVVGQGGFLGHKTNGAEGRWA